ncbi:hypothetical protein AB4144_12995, partial [Rhizobiaceae sp. 2RAB30]
DHRCPHMIQVRLKREKFQALSSPAKKGPATAEPAARAPGKGPARPPVITHKGVPIPAATAAPTPNTDTDATG